MRLAVVVIALCSVAQVARATVLVPADFREIVNGSDVIVYGRVVETAPDWSDDRKRIDTVVTIAAGTYLKGGPAQTVTFKVPGGQVGRYRSVFIGAPTFQAGEEIVLFLNTRSGTAPFIFGLNQGVYRVRIDPDTQRRIVVPPALMARGNAAEVVVRGSAARQPVPLETFGAQVRAIMSETGAAK